MRKIFTSIMMVTLLTLSPMLITNAQSVKQIKINNNIDKKCIATREGTYLSKYTIHDNGIKQKTVDTFLKKTYTNNNKECVELHETETTYTISDELLKDNKSALFDLISLNVNAAGSEESKKKKESDKTGTVKCVSTITYTITKNGNKEYIKMIKASGKLKSLTGSSGSSQGSGISITSNKVTVGVYGVTSAGKTIEKKHNITCANKPCTWSYSPSWSAVAYSSGTFIYKTGTVQTVKLKRGNSNWVLEMTNHV